jgi:hypothetical protein
MSHNLDSTHFRIIQRNEVSCVVIVFLRNLNLIAPWYTQYYQRCRPKEDQ